MYLFLFFLNCGQLLWVGFKEKIKKSGYLTTSIYIFSTCSGRLQSVHVATIKILIQGTVSFTNNKRKFAHR